MNLLNYAKTSLDVLLTFLFFFSFPCNVFYRSSVLALPIILLLVAFNRKTMQKVYALVRTSQVWRSLAWPLIMAIYTCLWTRILQAFDDSLVRSSLIYFAFLVGSFLLYCHLSRRHGPLGVLRIIFYVFVVQSVIQIISFVWEPFLQLSREISPIAESSDVLYGYITWRGFALSGVKFFGLSVVYSLVFVCHVFFQKKNFDWKELVLLVVFVTGGLFSARSFFLGILVALGVLVLSSRGLKTIFKLTLGAILLIFAFPIIAPIEVQEKFSGQLFPWLFEFYHSYQNTGKATVKSFNALMDGHHFALTAKQIFLGDGCYETFDGMPYGDTDAGYWRVLLFGGIPYLLLRVFFILRVLRPIYLLRLRSAKMLFFSLFGMLILFEVKGDVLGGLTMMTMCLFIFSMSVHELNLTWHSGARLGVHGWVFPKLFPRNLGVARIQQYLQESPKQASPKKI
ncbi:MAG: hypothetical protein LBD01_03695 [Puniceicoccales bacterium]|jgi:hypothetical protein|nr:hypothetical protein [Puniceicoccales bacterium]